jgi:UDP-N-acetylmuramoylalanine--D-glutamate ligase
VKGLRVGILGAGRSGVAAAKLLHRLRAMVLLSDKEPVRVPLPKGISVETGKHSDRLLHCDLIIRSPGIPDHHPILQKARKKKIPIWSELELASRYSRAKHVVAITGTNGKTTTTTLVGEFFKATKQPTFVTGNIGKPLSDVALKTTPKSTIVLEVSSYQLENIQTFHPTISAILNITPDHLEHHGTMKAYADAKARIFENQTPKDVCLLNADDDWFRHRWPLRTNLPGPHNVENVLASIAMALVGGVPLSMIRQVLARFRGVEHRLELVRTLRGVRYINDSKATNVDSTRVALASFSEPLIIILGGQGKGAPYTPLKPFIKKQVKQMLLIGEDSPKIGMELKGVAPMEKDGDLVKAVARASRLAAPGDVVLLSPACASFDQYHNYEERGRHFKALVGKLR